MSRRALGFIARAICVNATSQTSPDTNRSGCLAAESRAPSEPRRLSPAPVCSLTSVWGLPDRQSCPRYLRRLPLRWWSPPVVRFRIWRGSRKRGVPPERTRLPTTPRAASTYRTGFSGSGSISHLNKQCWRWRRVNGAKKKLSIRQRDTSAR